MIDTSPSSIRVFAIIVLSIIWLLLLNRHLIESKEDVK